MSAYPNLSTTATFTSTTNPLLVDIDTTQEPLKVATPIISLMSSKKPGFLKRICKRNLTSLKDKIEAAVSPQPMLACTIPSPNSGEHILPVSQLCAKAARRSRKGKSALIARQAELICQWKSEAVVQEHQCRLLEDRLRQSQIKEAARIRKADATREELAQTQVALANEKEAHRISKGMAEAEAARLLAHSNVLRSEYLSTSDNLKCTRAELTKTRQDAVDAHKEATSSNAALEKLRGENEKTEKERAKLFVDLATAYDELEVVKEDRLLERTEKEAVQTTLQTTEEEVIRLAAQLRDRDFKLREKEAVLSDTQNRLNATQLAFEEYKEDTRQFISALEDRARKSDKVAHESRAETVRTRDELRAAHDEVALLHAQVIEKDTTLSHAKVEVAQTNNALKLTEEIVTSERTAAQAERDALSAKLLAEETAHSVTCANLARTQDSLAVANALASQLPDVEAKLAATENALKVAEEKIHTGATRVITLEAELEQATRPVTPAPLVNEDVVSRNTELESTLQAKEDRILVLTQIFERECEAHQATLDHAQSLQTRLAIVSKDLKVSDEKVNVLESKVESSESVCRALKEKITIIVDESSKQQQQQEQSKRSVEKLLMVKISRCEVLEKENKSLRERPQSTPSTLSLPNQSTPFSNITNASTSTPPLRTTQKAKGRNWFGTATPFRWSSPASSPLATSSPIPSSGLESQSSVNQDTDKGVSSTVRGDLSLETAMT